MMKIKFTIILVLLAAILICLINKRKYNHPVVYVPPSDFPYIQQPDSISCGPACATMLLNYYGKDVTFEEVKKATKTEWFKTKDGQSVGMTDPEMLQIALFQFGVPCKVERGDLNKLKYYVSRGKFPIVLIRSSNITWHYIVVFGYDGNNIYFAEPGEGKISSLKNETFLNAWKFSHDTDNIKVGNACPVCQGDGQIFDVPFFGKCDICAGTGRIDYMKMAIKTADIYGNTMIVPVASKMESE